VSTGSFLRLLEKKGSPEGRPRKENGMKIVVVILNKTRKLLDKLIYERIMESNCHYRREEREMAVTSANKVADFFLCFSMKHGDCLTNLKLQKLLYYAQAWHLVIFNEALFDDPIEAWVHGPVVYAVWNRFRDYRWNHITEKPDCPDLPLETKKHLIRVFGVFGKYSAYDLERMTHNEAPWKRARHGMDIDEAGRTIIAVSDMKAFYTRVASED